MHRLLAVAVSACFVLGCGETKYEPKPLTEEEKLKIQAEDRQIADEESYGTAGKVKAKAVGKK